MSLEREFDLKQEQAMREFAIKMNERKAQKENEVIQRK